MGAHRLILAQILAQAGRTEDARAAAEEARAMARTQMDRAEAGKVLQELERMNAQSRVIEKAPRSEPVLASGGAADQTESIPLYRKGCSAGDARARLALAMALEHGLGVIADAAETAAAFFERACTAGQFQACHDLAHLYDSGIGVTADRARARALYQQACTGGYAPSCQGQKQSGPARGSWPVSTLRTRPPGGRPARATMHRERLWPTGKNVVPDDSQHGMGRNVTRSGLSRPSR